MPLYPVPFCSTKSWLWNAIQCHYDDKTRYAKKLDIIFKNSDSIEPFELSDKNWKDDVIPYNPNSLQSFSRKVLKTINVNKNNRVNTITTSYSKHLEFILYYITLTDYYILNNTFR